MTLLVRKPAVLAVRNSKVTNSLRLQFKNAALLSWQTARHLPQTPSCLGNRPKIWCRRPDGPMAEVSHKEAVAASLSGSVLQASKQLRKYGRKMGAWPSLKGLWSHLNRLVMMKLNLVPRPGCDTFSNSWFQWDSMHVCMRIMIIVPSGFSNKKTQPAR